MNAITIDGPAASGKSAVGREVAKHLDFLFLDTGIMYRAVTWAALERGIDIADSAAVGRIAELEPIEISAPRSGQSDGLEVSVQIGGRAIRQGLRTPLVDRNVSAVSAIGKVRLELSRQQRRIGLLHSSGGKAGIVMAGRDIGTVVLPEASLKIYLLAPAEERAKRRRRELAQRGEEADLAQILSDMLRRDKIDSERAIAPLRPADDAHQIQTHGSSVQQIVEQILALARARRDVHSAAANASPVAEEEGKSSQDGGS